MPGLQTKPLDPSTTEHRACLRCGTQMHLASIQPEKDGYDRRTFQCAKCAYSEDFIVKVWKAA
jgi:hypothetical protein